MVRFVWILVGFAIGSVVGWVACGKFSPEWVSAVGTCVGAVGTIAAILWAVHTFQHESKQRQDDLDRAIDAKAKRELDLAQNVEVRCSGGSADGFVGGPGRPDTYSLNSVWIRLINGTSEPVTIENFDLPGIVFRGNVMRLLPSTLAAGQTFRDTIDVEPTRVTADEVSDRGPLKQSVPVLRYRISGVTWERIGGDAPRRCSSETQTRWPGSR